MWQSGIPNSTGSNLCRRPKEWAAISNAHQIPNTNKLVEFAMAARTWDEWHRTLSHISIGAIKTLKNNNLVEGMDIDKSKESTQCAACIQGHQTVEPFLK